jgi:hypothetical protein
MARTCVKEFLKRESKLSSNSSAREPSKVSILHFSFHVCIVIAGLGTTRMLPVMGLRSLSTLCATDAQTNHGSEDLTSAEVQSTVAVSSGDNLAPLYARRPFLIPENLMVAQFGATGLLLLFMF